MINVFTPNAEQLARGVALNLAFRFGMSTAEPFKASKYVGKEKNPELLDLGELEGRTWLTSLALIWKKTSLPQHYRDAMER